MDELEISHRIYDLLAKLGGPVAPKMRAWTGEEWGPADAAAAIVLNRPGALRSMLLPPSDLSAAEAYIYDDIDFEGDLYSLLRFAAALGEARRGPLMVVRLLSLLRDLTCGQCEALSHQIPSRVF